VLNFLQVSCDIPLKVGNVASRYPIYIFITNVVCKKTDCFIVETNSSAYLISKINLFYPDFVLCFKYYLLIAHARIQGCVRGRVGKTTSSTC
jgi:hypothetical protein